MNSTWIECQRRRWMRNDAHLHVRQDAHRFAPPGAARSFRARDARWDPLGAVERKYSPDQPRVPAGNPDGGQWTTGSSGGGISIALPAGQTLSGGGTGADFNGAIALPEIVVSASDEIGGIGDKLGFGGQSDLDGFVHLAGGIPTGESPPEIPKVPPLSIRLRNILIRALVRELGPEIWVAVEVGSWVYDHKEEINAYFDAPKNLEELQDGVNNPAKGYDVHHVVERNSAVKDGSENNLIEAPENKVRIPRWKHWEINRWYETSSDDFGGLTPRKYLKGKSWDERTRVGLFALKKFGVLR